MSYEGNTEGTFEPKDSVETAPGSSFANLQEVCRTIHGTRDLAHRYNVSVPQMAAEMKRQGIVKFTKRDQVEWSQLEELYRELQSVPAVARRLSTTEKIVYKEMIRRGIDRRSPGHVKGQVKSESWREASAKHWNDPVWREQQRQKWLEIMPKYRKGKGISVPEGIMHTALLEAGISFKANRVVLSGAYIVDILVDQKPVIIEIDGFTHVRGDDEQRERELREAGYQVIRVTSRDVFNTPSACAQRVIDECQLIAEDNPNAEIRSDAQALGELVNIRRQHDPEFRARWIENLKAAHKRRHEERERKMVIQSGLHGPREDMQSSAEMTEPRAKE